jgi:hypothetical protein
LAATFAAPRPKRRPALIAVVQPNADCVALRVATLQTNDAGEMLIWQREQPKIWFENRPRNQRGLHPSNEKGRQLRRPIADYALLDGNSLSDKRCYDSDNSENLK